MSKATTVELSDVEQAELFLRVTQKLTTAQMARSCCDGCGKVMPEAGPIVGYASGEELGLCSACAAEVNTEHDIEKAIISGHVVYGRAKGYLTPRQERLVLISPLTDGELAQTFGVKAEAIREIRERAA